ncbi:MAG: glycosyl transferase, partial [Rhodococcus sp. (in: high G+C Gram-positive bacteria)]
MYDGWPALREGYARWLWNAFGSVAGTSVVVSAMSIAYIVPPAAAVLGSGPTRRWGLVGYGAAVLSRTVASRAESKSGSLLHTVAVSTAHPVSFALYITLTAESLRRRRDGTATWKNRLLPAV